MFFLSLTSRQEQCTTTTVLNIPVSLLFLGQDMARRLLHDVIWERSWMIDRDAASLLLAFLVSCGS